MREEDEPDDRPGGDPDGGSGLEGLWTPTDLPVLGLPGWPGRRGMMIFSGAGFASDRQSQSVLHSYLPGTRRPGRRRRVPPVIVLSQTRAPDRRDTALLRLLAHGDRPEQVRRVAEFTETVLIGGTPVTALRHHWTDPRVADAQFGWADCTVVAASWQHPLDAAFFAALARL
ncbi:hypothetical protein ACIGXM_05300 [Kitasatospora sp. NPDC052896]|uniref:hypothetical protein n=1 Tax=Kitasatospora sp. NPDC052896 TaxID=3364061 RepID=UPI0037CB5B79